MTDYDWTRAVDLALTLVEGQTDAAGAQRLGVSESTLRRWRAMRGEGEEIPEPRGGVREVLLRTMMGSGALNGGGDSRSSAKPEGIEPDEVWRRLDAVEADESLTAVGKMLKGEQILAAGRIGVHAAEARAADTRARVLDRESAGGERRAAALDREAETAGTRVALVVQPGGATTARPERPTVELLRLMFGVTNPEGLERIRKVIEDSQSDQRATGEP